MNVLCCNLGGTKELVKDDGIILNADKMWSGKYLPSSIKLDSLEKKVVAKGIHKLMKIKTKPDVCRFKIDDISKKYVKVIRKVMDEK